MVGAELSSYRSHTDLYGAKRLEDRLNSLNLNYHQVYQPEENIIHGISIALVQGLNIADSKILDTQTGSGLGEPDFSKLTANYEYRYIFKRRWELLAQIDGQYAANELPGSERYSIGGAGFGRAYDSSEITGDHGLAGRTEFAYRYTNAVASWMLRPYAFYDIGEVWQINPQASRDSASLASLGLGLRVTGDGVSFYLEAAKPLTRPVASQGNTGKHTRVFGGLAYEF